MQVGGYPVVVTRKPIKHLYLRVKADRIQVSAPKHWPTTFVEQAIEAKRSWLEQQQVKLAQQPQTPIERSLEDGSVIPYRGDPLTLSVCQSAHNSVHRVDGQLQLNLRHADDPQARKRQLDSWYREQLKRRIDELLDYWQPIMGVSASGFGVRKMKTRWGSCNIVSKKIWLSFDLIKYSDDCLEYVVVHELTHLYERYHNARFYQLMDHFLPDWRRCKQRLNSRDEIANGNGKHSL